MTGSKSEKDIRRKTEKTIRLRLLKSIVSMSYSRSTNSSVLENMLWLHMKVRESWVKGVHEDSVISLNHFSKSLVTTFL